MYLSIATTHRPATNLGFLLHKHPDRVHKTELSFGKAYLFYPEASDARCEAALVLEVDPVGLVRGRGRAEGLQDHYVNDRPYAASSLLSVALSRCLGMAMTGISKERPDFANAAIPLETHVTPLPVRGADDLVNRDRTRETALYIANGAVTGSPRLGATRCAVRDAARGGDLLLSSRSTTLKALCERPRGITSPHGPGRS